MKNLFAFYVSLAVLTIPASAWCQKNITFKSIPYNLEVLNFPENYKAIGDTAIEITSGSHTNLFNNPNGKYFLQNAPMLLFEPDSSFVLTAKVSCNHKEIYDVAALVVYQDKDLWAKLCFENSVEKKPTIVSVVTRKYSDDCNSMTVSDNSAYLAVKKTGNEFSLFYSRDGIKWNMIRHFRLDLTNKLKVGFAVHCSRADRFSAIFSDITYNAGVSKLNLREF